MPEQILYTKQTGENEQLRATVSQFKGKTYVGLRTWWRESPDDPEWKPGKGISVPQGEKVRFLLEAADAIREWSKQP